MLNISLRPWKPASRPASRPALKPASRLASSLKAHPREAWRPASKPASRLASCLKTYSRGSGSLPRGLPRGLHRSLSGGLHHAITNPRSLGGLPRGLPRSSAWEACLMLIKHIYFRCFEASMRPSLCASCGLKFYKAPQFPTAIHHFPLPYHHHFHGTSNNSII